MAVNLPSAAVHGDDLAHGRPPVADARVERAQVELEAAALPLVDRGHERVEAPTLAIHLDDVALPDALGRQPPGRRGTGRRSGEEARLLHRARDASAAPGRRQRPPPTPRGAGARSPRGRCARAGASWSFADPPSRARASCAARALTPA